MGGGLDRWGKKMGKHHRFGRWCGGGEEEEEEGRKDGWVDTVAQ